MEEDREEETYFNQLPSEILLKIFDIMPTGDLMNFFKAYPQFEDLPTLMNSVDYSTSTQKINPLDVWHFMSKESTAQYITVFNMSYIYWAPAVLIRECLKKFMNLRELYLLGTTMRMSEADLECYKKLKLRKFAVPINERELLESTADHFKHLESLCVQIITKSKGFQERFDEFVRELINVRELWIDDIYTSIPLSCDDLLDACDEIELFVFKGPQELPLSRHDLEIILLSDCTGNALHGYLETNEEVLDLTRITDPDTIWGRLLKFSVPYGLSDAKKLASSEKEIDEIFFQELDLTHGYSITDHSTIHDKRSVFFSENTKFLKKLSVNTCLFEDQFDDHLDEVEFLEKIHEFGRKFKNHMKHLNEFELRLCQGHEDAKMYYMVRYLRKLTHLYLEIPTTLKGQFFKQIMVNCEVLHTLNICLPEINETFSHNFCSYISLAKNLKNLRFDTYKISFERFFFVLSLIKEPKMERLYLVCDMIDNFGLVNMRHFLQLNPNLNILAIASIGCSPEIVKQLKDDMKSFMKSPEKVFIIERTERSYDYPFASKDFCKFQLKSSDTFVGNFNAFDDFPKKNLADES